jgi:uncharacterized membrane protein (DUF106 family)
MATNKKHNLLTIYLGLISLVSFIGLCIAVIVFANTIISKKLITDEEYMAKNSREITRCDEPIYLNEKTKERTTVEKEKCVSKAKKTMILQRNVNSKETMILSLIRSIILLIVFPIHFIYFRKNMK